MNIEEGQLVDRFYQTLVERGISSRRAFMHRENILFFIEGFLSKTEPKLKITEIDEDTLRFFLGSWYPTKVLGSKTELANMLTSFRRFFYFLFELGIIGKEALEKLLGVLSYKNYFLERFEQYKELEFNDNEMALNWYLGFGEFKGNPSFEMKPDFELDNRLYLLIHNLEKPRIRIILDFRLFLEYLEEQLIKLTPGSFSIPTRHLHRLNQRFTEPEQLPRNATQDLSPRISLFYHLARFLNFFILSFDHTIRLTNRVEKFLELDQDAQLTILLDSLWNHLPWSELERYGANGFAHWAQEHRGGFAELLGMLKPGELWKAGSLFDADRHSRMLTSYLLIYEVVENRILFALKEMGILDYSFKKHRDAYLIKYQRGIDTISLTRFGKKIMLYLAKQAKEESRGESLLDRMEQGLVFI